MKTASPELIALLAGSTQFLMADAYEFVLLDGTVIRSCSWDQNIILGGMNLVGGALLQAGYGWLQGQNGTGVPPVVTPNASTAPDGTKSAMDMILDRGAGSTSADISFVQSPSLVTPSGRTYTAGVWLKGTAGQQVAMRQVGNSNPQIITFSGVWQKTVWPEATTSSLSKPVLGVLSRGTWNATNKVQFSIWHPQVQFGTVLGPFAGMAAPTTPVDTRVTYSANGLKIKRNRTRVAVGLEVDEMELTVTPASTDTVGSLPFMWAVNNGLLDGATFTLRRVFLSDPATVVDSVVLFSGSVSEIAFSRSEANVKVKSELERLNINTPPDVYQPSCRRTFGDALCGFDKESISALGTMSGGNTNRVLNVTGFGQAAGYFDQGVLLFTSGDMAGIKRTILTYAPGKVTLGLPLPRVPGYGDGIKLYPGCDKTPAKCASYGNSSMFSAEPFIPVPETAR
jgi:uncharacterized phage protein (TIGR02218 family)